MLKKVATSLLAYSAVPARWDVIRPGEMGSILMLLGILTEERLRGPV